MARNGSKRSIYSFWNEALFEREFVGKREEAACGMRFGSVTRFGELFDWPQLSAWLVKAGPT